LAGPVAGWLSDRYGARPFATGGMAVAAVSFALLMLLPANFAFPVFALLLLMNGIGVGMFAAPNTTGIMNSVPANQRGVASGMRATFQNAGMVLSIGLFFSLMVVGLAGSLPSTMSKGLIANGVPPQQAAAISHEPPVASLFAAFLGYNPMEKLLGPKTLASLPKADAARLTGKQFFPGLISKPFITGLRITFTASLIMSLIAAWASWLRGSHTVAVDDEAGPFGAPIEEGEHGGEAPVPEEWVPA
jgi:MFS family permease